MKITFIIFAFLFISSCSPNGDRGFYKGYQTPVYNVVKKTDNFEIRQYRDVLVTEVEVSGTRKEAAKKGFRILARYIFGNNASNLKISMTSPVVQFNKKDDKWIVQFTMPREHDLTSLPKPQDEKVKFKIIPKRKFVVLTFDGTWSDENFNNKTNELKIFAKKNKINTLKQSILAYYDDPFTFPWNRRNEVMLEIR